MACNEGLERRDSAVPISTAAQAATASERRSAMPVPKAPEPRPGAAKSERKPWKKKTPVEVVLEQADKLRAEITQAEEELKAKKRQLAKFEEARKLFESA
jgi:hypothetical protein